MPNNGAHSQISTYGQAHGYIKENNQKPPEIPLAAKAVVPAGQFMSASILPKGTSVRKKFVPPFKKTEANLKELS